MGKREKSKYFGVYRRWDGKKWVAQVIGRAGSIYIGSYDDEIDAAKAHDKVLKKTRGRLRFLNFKEQ